MQNDPAFKICPACGQPALLKDLECLKCGHNFRFGLDDAKAASGIPTPPPSKPTRRPAPLHWATTSGSGARRSSPWLDAAGWILVVFMVAACIYSAKRILTAQGVLEQQESGRHNTTAEYQPGGAGPAPVLPAPYLPGVGDVHPDPSLSMPHPIPTQPTTATDSSGVPDYLGFLHQVDQQRSAMQRQQATKLMALCQRVTGSNVTSEMSANEQDVSSTHNATYSTVQESITEVTTEWEALGKLFRSKTAPASCQQLAACYSDALDMAISASVTTMTDFEQALQAMAANDTARISQITDSLKARDGTGSNSDSARINAAFRRADQALADVCVRLGLRKPFDINPGG